MNTALFILMISAGVGMAQEDFVPPASYPVERYEAAWKKNPFTLKTAPVAIEKISFAKDLALGAVYQIGDDTTVVVVNTKTRERFKLLNDQSTPAGIKVKAVYHADSRKDTYVEVEAGGEVAALRYDDNYQRQMAAQQQPPAGGANANASANHGSVGNVSAPGGSGNTAQGTQIAPPMTGNIANNNLNKPALPKVPGMNAAPGGGTSNVPTPQRRRLLTAPTPPSGR